MSWSVFWLTPRCVFCSRFGTINNIVPESSFLFWNQCDQFNLRWDVKSLYGLLCGIRGVLARICNVVAFVAADVVQLPSYATVYHNFSEAEGSSLGSVLFTFFTFGRLAGVTRPILWSLGSPSSGVPLAVRFDEKVILMTCQCLSLILPLIHI